MSRKYRLTGIDLGTDLQNLDIYHTEVTASNKIASNVTSSLLLSPGVVVEVDDNVTTFIARSINGDCSARTGSLSISSFNPNTRYFEVISDGQGYVSSLIPQVTSPTLSSFNTNINYTVNALFVIQATDLYPYNFEGWYNSVSGSGTLISTEATLSIGQNDYTSSLTDGKIYAYFG